MIRYLPLCLAGLLIIISQSAQAELLPRKVESLVDVQWLFNQVEKTGKSAKSSELQSKGKSQVRVFSIGYSRLCSGEMTVTTLRTEGRPHGELLMMEGVCGFSLTIEERSYFIKGKMFVGITADTGEVIFGALPWLEEAGGKTHFGSGESVMQMINDAVTRIVAEEKKYLKK